MFLYIAWFQRCKRNIVGETLKEMHQVEVNGYYQKWGRIMSGLDFILYIYWPFYIIL